MRGLLPGAVALLALTIPPAGRAAQAPGDTAPAPAPAPLVTLALWADDVWLALLDRDGAYFGRLADEGTFQRFNALMDDEYELDLWTGLFTPAEDAGWAEAEQGVRVAGASINHPFILNFADWRETIPIAGPVDLMARYRRQRSLTAQRDYTTVGVSWREVLGSPWTLSTSIGMHFFKASADLELGLARRFATGATVWTTEARVALLDTFNDVIFQGLGVRPEETEAHFDYERLPVAARLTLGARAPRWRAELHAGASNRSRVLVTFPASGAPAYRRLERVRFAGALGEAALGGGAGVAAYAGIARADTDRRSAAPAAQDFELVEETRLLGVRARATVAPALALELDLRAVWRPERRDRGDATVVRHRDRETFGQLALARRPSAGWTWRLGIAVVDRNAGSIVPRLTATHARQVMEGGYRFPSGFEVAGGVRWDLDQLARGPFDGGHLRFGAAW